MYLILALGAVAFLLSLLLTPLVRDVFRKMGVLDRPDAIRKHHAYPIPRVGGIAIAISYVGAFGLMLLMPFSYSTEIAKALPMAWKLLPAGVLIFATGLMDDLFGLRPWQKLLGQTAAAVMAYFAGVRIIFGDSDGILWSLPLTVLWMVGCANAFNLIDGLDGLAAGVGLSATATMMVAALTQNHLPLLVVTMPLAGCLLGFLRYNFNPASIFLGDCGSLLIGFLLGCYGALWSQKSATMLGMTAPLMAMAIPLLDAALSIVRRFLRHQPIFEADRGHIHHRLLARGITPRRAALILYGICGIAAALSLLQNAHNQSSGLVVVVFCGVAWLGIQHLGYVEFGMARELFFKGNFRRIIDAQTRLRSFQEALGRAATLDEFWRATLDGSRDFGFLGVRMKLQDRIFEERAGAPAQGPHWQVRIPLSGGQYLNFERDFSSHLTPVVIGAFVNTVEEALRRRLGQFETFLAAPPPAVARVEAIESLRRPASPVEAYLPH